MAEKELSRGVIFERRGDVTISGSLKSRSMLVFDPLKRRIETEDIDRAVEIFKKKLKVGGF